MVQPSLYRAMDNKKLPPSLCPDPQKPRRKESGASLCGEGRSRDERPCHLYQDLWDLCSFFFIAPTNMMKRHVKNAGRQCRPACELIEVLRAREPFDIEGTEELKAWINKGCHFGKYNECNRLALSVKARSAYLRHNGSLG